MNRRDWLAGKPRPKLQPQPIKRNDHTLITPNGNPVSLGNNRWMGIDPSSNVGSVPDNGDNENESEVVETPTRERMAELIRLRDRLAREAAGMRGPFSADAPDPTVDINHIPRRPDNPIDAANTSIANSIRSAANQVNEELLRELNNINWS